VGRDEERLLDLFERLAPEQQDGLIAFAEFLAGRPPDGTDLAREPVAVPRPDGETVTMAIRRLVRTYPMLDRRRLMVEASRFMAQHALEGRAAAEVIDDLERVFSRHYERYKAEGRRQKVEEG
jgi:hypothetical protein